MPFFRSRPSRSLLLAAAAVVVVGALLPVHPARARRSASRRCPWPFFAALVGMIVGYLALIEAGKRLFFAAARAAAPAQRLPRPHVHLRRRAAWFSVPGRRIPVRSDR